MTRLFLLLLTAVGVHAAEFPKTPNIVLIAGEYEYQSTNTLPAFKQYLESNYNFRCIYLERKDEEIPGLEALEKADLAILFARRMTPPEEQLDKIKQYLDSGKPLIGLRTASHAFENWKEFDHEVFGGNYKGHHGDTLLPTIRIAPEGQGHAILKNLPKEFQANGSLYKPAPLAKGTALLLTGAITNQPPEPVAWTHQYKGARVFYTSLGHPKDFEQPAFRLFGNAVEIEFALGEGRVR